MKEKEEEDFYRSRSENPYLEYLTVPTWPAIIVVSESYLSLSKNAYAVRDNAF